MGQVDRPADVVKSGARVRPRYPATYPRLFRSLASMWESRRGMGMDMSREMG
jgi:hypothetical protein